MPQPHLPSVFVSLEPYACRDYEGEISATGYLADVYGPGAGVARGDELGFANAPYFNAVYGFQKRVKDAFVSETSQNPTTFEAGSSPILAYREPTGYFDPTTKSFDLIDEGAGLFPTSMYVLLLFVVSFLLMVPSFMQVWQGFQGHAQWKNVQGAQVRIQGAQDLSCGCQVVVLFSPLSSSLFFDTAK
jgi:hypothetical protein